ncbi:50S ribosomal protein L35 [Candidatus Roizmanbacteria bacterium CG_4_9_14_0_2_um_filter_39_13]|uniref:Large ribosomal subunit protein bL35 n=2 Tax=Candidatus Roizmaniibacteriota TaxID=1752723 RepID=A0A2M8F369_9BACT|nr:MAG: 50S ribosomal protein L35 [Candidatus Roizmanbacteria bacterium CG_4_10_14_0_2_um_filter_39_12]PJC33754.1 MAG: 50S ribosomal protein L35 [Candidatus Roizmanbacteria bacterium CG_4_9_14_0_2_um_filter_39_13]PJE61825.1 MAG: 50S ribosomal protein L35 [Candidatus Roizmanbacteria bacterium CG10_big_fil_rev_8_21_14_0_10_39_12]
MIKTKQKTHKGASKRFKITGTGKVVHRSQKIRHLKANKSKRKLRALKNDKPVEGRMKTKIKKLLGKA